MGPISDASKILAREVARETDPDALLPGEDPGTASVEEAMHWLQVYSELLSLKLTLIERAENFFAGVSDDAIREAQLDQRLMRAEAERFRSRAAYWTERVRTLSAS